MPGQRKYLEEKGPRGGLSSKSISMDCRQNRHKACIHKNCECCHDGQDYIDGRWREPLSYHDVYITTAGIKRTKIFNLPYGMELSCTRVTGWQLWDIRDPREESVLLGGEYDGAEKWLVIDVAGTVILDSRRKGPDDEVSAG